MGNNCCSNIDPNAPIKQKFTSTIGSTTSHHSKSFKADKSYKSSAHYPDSSREGSIDLKLPIHLQIQADEKSVSRKFYGSSHSTAAISQSNYASPQSNTIKFKANTQTPTQKIYQKSVQVAEPSHTSSYEAVKLPSLSNSTTDPMIKKVLSKVFDPEELDRVDKLRSTHNLNFVRASQKHATDYRSSYRVAIQKS